MNSAVLISEIGSSFLFIDLLSLQLVVCRVAVLKRAPYIVHSAVYYRMFSLALIASSFRVTEDNLLFERDLSGPPSFF